MDEAVFPKLVEYKNLTVKAFQKHVVPIYGIVEEKLLNFIATLEKNEVFYKIHDSVINFLLSARKQAFNAVEWFSKTFQQIVS